MYNGSVSSLATLAPRKPESETEPERELESTEPKNRSDGAIRGLLSAWNRTEPERRLQPRRMKRDSSLGTYTSILWLLASLIITML